MHGTGSCLIRRAPNAEYASSRSSSAAPVAYIRENVPRARASARTCSIATAWNAGSPVSRPSRTTLRTVQCAGKNGDFINELLFLSFPKSQ